MDRQDAIDKLRQEARQVKPDQEFTVRRMTAEDAWGVAQCCYAVYGDGYPFETYYLPERLIAENRRKNLHTAVARTPCGEVVGYGGLYRSSAYSPKVYELGQYVVRPEYAATAVPFKLQEHLLEVMMAGEDIDELFAETACHHVSRQKMAALGKFRETALAVGLMPASYYPGDDWGDDRVSCLLQFRGVRDQLHQLYLPADYAQALEYILAGLELPRNLEKADAAIPPGSTTRLSIQFYDFAGVGRFNVQALGEDFAAVLEAAEAQAGSRGVAVLQTFVNLGEPWCARAIPLLRRRGYFFGGFLPRWFDTDGLLMQRVDNLPDLEAIRLYSERAHRILASIAEDLESNPLCRFAARPPKEAAEATATTPLRERAAADRKVVVSGSGLTLEDVVAVARYGAPAVLTDDAAVLARVASSASFIAWGVKTGEPIYGVNTGFGGMANVAIGERELTALQSNLIRFLKAGAGGFLPREDVRAAMLLRVNSHLRGVSGIRLELISRMLTFLNHGVTPLVRELGSIGASGDLIPLATITGAIIGADAAFEVDFQGERMDCLTALDRLGLPPFALGPKEGLGMVNGTSVMSGIAANCLHETRNLIALTFGFQALAFQALEASDQAFHPFIHQVKPHPGQILAADLMLRLLKGSRMSRHELDGHHESREGQPVQDRYSLRCLPQYFGPLLDGFRSAVAAVETEMNSASDNPIIDGSGCVSYHSGNFLGQYVGVWMDHLRYYLGLLAKHVDVQIALLVTPEFNGGLSASLVGNHDRHVNMGLKGLQICGNAILPLLSFYGNTIADRFPTHAEQFNQNINSQGYNSALLASKSVSLLRSYLALALIFGVQGVELRSFMRTGRYDPRKQLSPLLVPLYEAVRAGLDGRPAADRPLIWDDDQQSLDLYVEALSTHIAAESEVVAAMRPITRLLP